MALNLPERQCKWSKCGISFKPRRHGQEFHSAQCRALYHKHHLQCPHCGQWLDEPGRHNGDCLVCPFRKSLASKRGKKMPDASGRCIRPGGFCGSGKKEVVAV